jgi:hypothetical protein
LEKQNFARKQVDGHRWRIGPNTQNPAWDKTLPVSQSVEDWSQNPKSALEDLIKRNFASEQEIIDILG